MSTNESRGATPLAPDREDHGFKKVLGRLDAIALGFGAMIGFGWVILTGDWLNEAGTMGTVLALVTGGLIMAVVGLVYGELVAAMPYAGGEHNYLLRGMGARWAFVGSWAITGGYITIVAFEAVAVPFDEIEDAVEQADLVIRCVPVGALGGAARWEGATLELAPQPMLSAGLARFVAEPVVGSFQTELAVRVDRSRRHRMYKKIVRTSARSMWNSSPRR